MSESENSGNSLGIAENIACLLAYILGFISGVVLLVLEKKNEKIRFHAMQSILVSGVLIVLSIALSIVFSILIFIPGLGFVLVGLLSMALSLISFGSWIGLMVLAYMDKKITIPVITDLAEKLAPTVLK